MSKFAKFFALGVAALLAASMISAQKDARDINDRLIATTIAVDKIDGEIWFYVEFANIQSEQGSHDRDYNSSDPYFLLKGHGKTLPEARHDLDMQLNMPIYLGGVRTLLIGEALARDDLVEYLYRLRADEAYRKKVITITTRENLDKLYEACCDQDLSLGYAIENTIETLDESGEGFSRTTSRILENLSSTYTGILIPCIGLQDKAVALKGYSVVNGARVVGFIPIEESRGLTLLKADKAKTVYIAPYGQYEFTAEMEMTGRKIRPSYSDGQISFTVTMAFDATLRYGDLKTPYALSEKDGQALEKTLEERISQDLLVAVEQAQSEYRTDYLQMDDAFRIRYPVIFESLDWGEAFAGASVTPEVAVTLNMAKIIDYAVSKSK